MCLLYYVYGHKDTRLTKHAIMTFKKPILNEFFSFFCGKNTFSEPFVDGRNSTTFNDF